MSLAESDLISAARRGDAEAFDRLFAAAAGRVLLLVRVRLGREIAARADEEAVLADVYLAARAAVRGFAGQDRATFHGWLCTLASQRTADPGRFAARVGREDVSPLASVLELAHDAEAGPLTGPTRAGVRATVAAAIEALPAEQRDALLGHFFEGRTRVALAEAAETTPAMIQRRIAAAVLAVGRPLRRALEGSSGSDPGSASTPRS